MNRSNKYWNARVVPYGRNAWDKMTRREAWCIAHQTLATALRSGDGLGIAGMCVRFIDLVDSGKHTSGMSMITLEVNQ